MALETELKLYREKLPGWLPQNEGRYVAIFHEDVLGIFDTLDEALAAGYDKSLTEPFLARRIQEKEEVPYVSRQPALTSSRPRSR